MSAQQCFALCIDCWEFHYGISDSNGVYSRDSGSSNHWDHAVHVFGRPVDYASPIRVVLTKLHAGAPIPDKEMALCSLALAMEAVQPNNGVAVSLPPIIQPGTFGDSAGRSRDISADASGPLDIDQGVLDFGGAA